MPFVSFVPFVIMEFTELIDLASEKLGGAVLWANDDFFAPKENLLKARFFKNILYGENKKHQAF